MTTRRRPLSTSYTLCVCLMPFAALPACAQGCRSSDEGETRDSSSNTDSDTDSDSDTDARSGPDIEPAVCEALALARPMRQLCPPERLVAPCDAPPHPCFAPPENAILDEPRPGFGIFANHCVYELKAECAEEIGEISAQLEQQADPLEVARDCKVRFSGDPTQTSRPPLPSTPAPLPFRDWLTREADIPGLPPATGQVRVALIESATSGGALDKHGRLMQKIIEVSPQDGAGPEIVPYPVMVGGAAYASDIALAIERARLDWQQHAPDAQLIINLSLAWERLASLSAQHPQSPMVLHALQRASCDGALIIAAGGNESPYACPAGPVEPAMWTQRHRPDAEVCSSFDAFEPPGVQVTPAWGSCPDCPLVYAIGAIDEREHDLPDAREGSRVALATRGDMATLGGEGPMSGTSVSAGVVSGVAARLWSHDTTRDPADIMRALYEQGRARPAPDGQALLSELDLGTPREQRIIEPCAALLDLLDLDEPNPNELGKQPLSCPTNYASSPLELHARVPAFTVEIDAQELHSCPETGCGTLGPIARPDALAEVAPDPWSRPQPISYPCPPCKVKGFMGSEQESRTNTVLELELAADITESFSGVLVTLWDAAGNSEHHFYKRSQLQNPATQAPWAGEFIQLQDTGLYSINVPQADGSTIQTAPVEGWIEIKFDAGSEGNALGGFTPSSSEPDGGLR